MCKSLQNIEIKSSVLTLRELKYTDHHTLWGIIRDYSELATIDLYQEYMDNKNETIKNMEMTGLNYLFDLFKEMENSSIYNTSIIRKRISMCPDFGLFSPYGPLDLHTNDEDRNFSDKIKKYIKDAQAHNKPNRSTFKLAILDEDGLIGCIVFDVMKNEIIFNENPITIIGDLGIFIEAGIRRNNALPSVELIMYFIDKYAKLTDKDNLFISMTTHPCNQDTNSLFKKINNDAPELIKTEYGIRHRKIIPYSLMASKLLRRNRIINIKINGENMK